MFEAADYALELAPDDRREFVERCVVEEPSFGAELAAVLGGASDGTALDTPAWVFAAPIVDHTTLGETDASDGPMVFGPYRVLRELGRGGMATVYLAERADDQYRKQVAVKVFPRWNVRDHRRVQRFVEERQILASFDHPGIARLLDGGVTVDGLPWFAMEFVDGAPIDRYCDDRRLSIDERLELFCHVCAAVQYAHRNLVVHRDLKPSNILVSSEGRVALLDFGIAKLLAGQNGASAEAATVTTDRLLTPLYASPEQILGEPVSTATDVYALGILLHVLLTGDNPYRLTSTDGYSVVRAILEQETERPSDTIARAGLRASRAAGGWSVERAAEARGSTPAKLLRRLRGDLDAIVAKAIERNSTHRYASAEQLEADVRRHLTGQPVLARPENRLYVARKFVRRHRVGVGITAIVTALVLAFAVVSTIQAARIRAQAERLTLERDRTQDVSRILLGLLQGAAFVQPGRNVSAREILDSATAQIDQRTAIDTAQRAQTLFELARAYQQLGLLDKARSLVERAIALQREANPRSDVALARSAELLGAVLEDQKDLGHAEQAYTEALTLRRRELGARHRDVAVTLAGLSAVRRKQGRLGEAESLARQAVAIDEALPGSDRSDLARSTSALARAVLEGGNYTEAERLFRNAFGMLRETHAEEDPEIVNAVLDLATASAAAGQHQVADSLVRYAVTLSRRLAAAGSLNGTGQMAAPAIGRDREEIVGPVRRALAGSLPLPAPRTKPVASDDSRIVFASDRDGPDPVGDLGNSEIYIMNPDGSGQRRLTEHDGIDNLPDLSPDGTRIAFVSQRGGSTDLFVMNADGSDVRRLTYLADTLGVVQPAWSPDGKRIAFESRVRPHVYVINVDGTGLVDLMARQSAGGMMPAWAPDGKRIVFSSSRDGNPELYVMDADGENVVRLTFTDGADQRPDWSPDGRKIVFHSTRDGDQEIYVMNPDGSNQARLTTHPGPDAHPSWSPDSRRIVFHRRVLGHAQVYVMNADGSDQRRLTELSTVAYSAFASWGPAARASPQR